MVVTVVGNMYDADRSGKYAGFHDELRTIDFRQAGRNWVEVYSRMVRIWEQNRDLMAAQLRQDLWVLEDVVMTK